MRTVRLFLAGTVILALLGGLGAAAIAQDDGSGRATYFTGTRTSAVETETGDWREEDGVARLRGARAIETVDWSDPRLPSEMQISQNVDMLAGEAAVFGTTLLEGPEGYWTGQFIAYCDVESVCSGMNALTGHGAYEGLFAVMRAFDDIEGPEFGDWVFEGLILEGEMPPMPDPVEPSPGE